MVDISLTFKKLPNYFFFLLQSLLPYCDSIYLYIKLFAIVSQVAETVHPCQFFSLSSSDCMLSTDLLQVDTFFCHLHFPIMPIQYFFNFRYYVFFIFFQMFYSSGENSYVFTHFRFIFLSFTDHHYSHCSEALIISVSESFWYCIW